MARRFNSYLAGSVMVLIGLLLLAYLTGLLPASLLAPLFLCGVGVVFSVMAVLKTTAPASYEMAPRTTLAYGVLAIVVGVLWVLVSVATILVGYVLALVLIFFGAIFLAYTRIRPKST